MVERIVGLFLEHAPQRLQLIREGIEKEEWYSAERGAHSMRSSAGSLGLGTLQDLSGRLEEACEGRRSEAARSLLSELVAVWEQLRPKIEQILLPPL